MNKKFKALTIILNCVLCAAVIALTVVFTVHGKLIEKALASAGFVLIGLISFVYAAKTRAGVLFPALMLGGLILAMAGDIVLNITFIPGVVLFALAHVLYLCSFAALEKFKPLDAIIGVVIFTPSLLFITLAPIFDFGGVILEVACIAYALILSLMVGKATGSFARKICALNAVIAVGSVLFFASDFALLINMFAVKSLTTRIICLGTYYPAQLLFAASIVVFCTAKEGGVSLATRIFTQIFQWFFKVALPVLPYKDPKVVDAISDIPAVLKENGKKKPLLVTDKTVYSLGLCRPLEESLKAGNIPYAAFCDVVANPTCENVESALEIFKKEGCDSIIAFGGGSPMDCAKGVGARVARPKKTLNKLGGILKVRKKIPLLIAVPTTAGTGSETTLACVVVDEKTRHKYAINDFPLIPKYAVLDEEVTKSLPQHIAATTGMDALTHAIEAFIGRSGNADTRQNALEAIKLIFENIEEACSQKTQAARKNMLIASHKAGKAFSKAYVGYVHAVAHSLGGRYDTPHGLANAVILPVILREYGRAAHKKLKRIAVYCGLVAEDAASADGAKAVIEKIEQLNKNLNIPETLRVEAADLDELVGYAYKEVIPLYPTPVLWGKAKLKEIYKAVGGLNE